MLANALLTASLSAGVGLAEEFQVFAAHTFDRWLKAVCRDRHLVPPRVEHGGAEFENGGVHGVIFWPRKDATPTFFAVSLPANGDAMSPKSPGGRSDDLREPLEHVELHVRRHGDELSVRIGPRRVEPWAGVADISKKVQANNPDAWWKLTADADVRMKEIGSAIDAVYCRGEGTLMLTHAALPSKSEQANWREEMRAAVADWPMKQPPGEILIVLAEDAPYSRLNGLLGECGLADCWKLTLAVVDDEMRWSKLPLYLPQDDALPPMEEPPPPEEDDGGP